MPGTPDETLPDGDLLELGRLALLGKLARGVVHELNNPLFVLLALADLMLRAAEPGTQAAERLGQMHASAVEMRGLVAALGELARAPVGRDAEPVAVAAALQGTVDLIRRVSLRKDVDIVERYDDGGALVLAGRGELELAMLGLLADAQDAIPEAGRIEIVSLRNGERVRVAVRWPGQPDGGERLEPLDAILAAVVAGRGGSVRRGPSAAGGAEAVLTLPLYLGSG